MIGILKAIDRAVEKFSGYTLVICVLTMLFFSVLTIVLRWFNTSFHWSEPFIRHLVFLSAFLGGVIATGRKTHIGIDIFGKYLESKKAWTAHLWVNRVISLASFGTLMWLIYASFNFIAVEAKYGKVIFLGVHSKFLVSIIPFGFGLIGYRFLFLFVNSFFEKESHGEVA